MTTSTKKKPIRPRTVLVGVAASPGYAVGLLNYCQPFYYYFRKTSTGTSRPRRTAFLKSTQQYRSRNNQFKSGNGRKDWALMKRAFLMPSYDFEEFTSGDYHPGQSEKEGMNARWAVPGKIKELIAS